jgi:fructose-bisphosphate aldolase class II
VSLALTVLYDHRPQAVNFTHTRRWDIGLKLFLEEAKVLTAEGGPFENVDVLIHLDHVQYDDDAELLKWDLSQFSSIMYDASKLPLDENIRKTAEFVRQNKGILMIEGACDEIVDATGSEHNDITSADTCERYVRETGVDMVVANLGTEHRASGKNLRYHGEAAREICKRIGHRIVLHGTSSVTSDQIKALYEDGICKVNIWTALERDTSPILLRFLVENAGSAAGAEASKLKAEGLLGINAPEGAASLKACCTAARQEVVFNGMKDICRSYFNMWYI